MGKNGLLGAAIAAPVVGFMLATGASPAEAATEGYKWGMPLGDAQIEFKNAAQAGYAGDEFAKKYHLSEGFKSATIDGAGWGAGMVAAAKTAATAESGSIMSTLMKAKNLLSVTGWGMLASAATAIGFDIYDDLAALGPETEIQKTQLLQDQLIYGLDSPLPQAVTIQGQDMELSEALRQYPDKVKAAFAENPEAMEIVTAYLALEDYKAKWMPQEPEAALPVLTPQETNIPGGPGQKL